jgi:hypothetical protein
VSRVLGSSYSSRLGSTYSSRLSSSYSSIAKKIESRSRREKVKRGH